MTKVKGLLARLESAVARVIAEMSSITTDRGVLSWDTEEDLKEGDRVYMVDPDGQRVPAADGDYKTSDEKTIIVVDGAVAEIKDPVAEVAPEPAAAEPQEAAEQPVKAAEVNTDKGVLSWDGEEDLKEGDAVYMMDADGNRVPAADGEYTTEDGKVISVADGKVASITDPAAEVAEQQAQPTAFERIAQAFSESYDEKARKIYDAIHALGFDGWLVDCGDDFAVLAAYGEDKFNRFAISWDADGNAIAENPVLVVPAFVTPEERDKADAEFTRVKEDYEKVCRELEEMKATPAGKPAHEEFTGEGKAIHTGNKGLDRLAKLMGR